jgi:NDP-sugar pyrophosphorylase family protein
MRLHGASKPRFPLLAPVTFVADERWSSRLSSLVKAVVFAGGEGARLLPYTSVLPKPLLPVGDRPVLEIIVAQLREAGITEIVLATGYLSSLIETYFGDGSNWGVHITYNREKRQLGTVGALPDVPGLDETFIMMNGDVLATPLYRELVEAHHRAGAAATIATKLQAVDVDYGVLRLGDPVGPLRTIEGIDEKPRYAWPVSMGIYAIEPRVIRLVEPGRRMDLPNLVERLIEEGETVAAYDHSGYWQDIGRLHDLEAAVQAFEGSADDFVGSARLDLEGSAADAAGAAGAARDAARASRSDPTPDP